MATTAASLGAGFLTMGQQMMAAMTQPQATPPAGGSVPPPIPAGAGGGAMPDLLGTTDVAKILGVSETDVVASLEKGDIKGKKIGSTWRVTKTALDEFLKS